MTIGELYIAAFTLDRRNLTGVTMLLKTIAPNLKLCEVLTST